MKIEHIAIWTRDLERLKDFYLSYFDAQANEKFVNPSNGFESYFLSFASGPRLEFMTRPDVEANASSPEYPVGYSHLAFSLGTKELVDSLTNKLRQDDYKVVSEPRTTGDGYYESIIADPDGNLVEITI